MRCTPSRECAPNMIAPADILSDDKAMAAIKAFETRLNKWRFLGSLLFLFGLMSSAQAQNESVVHWINDSGADAFSVLSAGGVFVTSFKQTNDVSITAVSGPPGGLIMLNFGETLPGNNPWYITQFQGKTNNGTGNGTNGFINTFFLTFNATVTMQFDFASPLTPNDRIILTDIDSQDAYTLQAYIRNGISYQAVNMTGWLFTNYSGHVGTLPDSRWPVWNAAAQTLTSGTNLDLFEDICELRADRNIDRFTISRTTSSGGGSGIQFLSPGPLASLKIRSAATNSVITWPAVFSNLTLYATANVNGSWTNVSGTPSVNNGFWTFTNYTTNRQLFYRLQGQN